MMKNNLVKQLLNMGVSIFILSQGLMASVTTTPEQDREEFVEYLKTQQEVYKAEFDKEMILESLDYDIDKIIDFVSNKIVYQAYDGILRGIEGTLIGRAGNSHDQALTLASMLNDADVEAQIMVGELTKEQADELNQNIRMATLPKLPIWDKNKQPNLVKKFTTSAEKRMNTYNKEKKNNIEGTPKKLAQNIYENIPKEVQEEGIRKFKNILRESTIPYRWVRYKNEESNAWIEVHPAYKKAEKWKVKATSIEVGTVKEDALQKFSIELWIQNSDGKKHSITGKWSAPTANLTGKTISVEIMSDAMLKTEGIKNLSEQLGKSHYFFVRINESLPKEGKVFDIKGGIYPASTLEGLNTVFAEVGKKLGNVNSMFNDSLNFNKTTKNTSVSLQKVWLEFSIEKPNRKTKMIQRILFEGSPQTKHKELALALLQGWDISVNTTKPMNHFYQKQSSKQLLDEVEFINNFKDYVLKNKNDKEEKILNVASSLVPNRALIQLSSIRNYFDRVNFDNTVSYLSEVNLLALRKGFLSFNDTYGFYQTMDILSNTRWSFEKKGKNLEPSFLTSIKHGVWETEAETYKVVEEKGIRYLNSAFNSLTSNTSFPIKTEIFNPHTLNHKDKAWWQVDSKTGSTKGMIKLPYGYAGGDATEYGEIVDLITGKISEYFFIKGTVECIGAGASPACCAAINGALWAAGIAGGKAGAASKGVKSFGERGAATYMGIASVEFDVATSTLPVTDLCKKFK